MDYLKTPLIYLASPYTHSDAEVRQKRYEQACQAVAALFKAGIFAYSPIVNTHHLTNYELGGTWESWADYDLVFLRRCTELWVLMLDGWQTSKGVTAEIRAARSWGMPVRYVSLDDLVKQQFRFPNPSTADYNEPEMVSSGE